MRIALDEVQIHDSGPVTDRVLVVLYRFQNEGLLELIRRIEGQPVRLQRPWREVHGSVVIVGHYVPVRHGDRALMHVGAKAAGVVEVVMRADDVLIRLSGKSRFTSAITASHRASS